MCTFVLKETVAYYTSYNTTVYCCLLDATKAFDRISHTKLFDVLVERGFPAVIVRFMMNAYLSQFLNVRWSSHKSDSFRVCNGVNRVEYVAQYCSVST